MTDDRQRPIDPDVDLSVPAQRLEIRPHEWDLLAVIAAGAVIGAEARYGISTWITHPVAAMPWSTVVINAARSLIIGLLMAYIDGRGACRLLRPFVGVGILGGFTTFSTFAVDVDSLIHAHRVGVAVGYLAATILLCAVAVFSGYRAGRRAFGGAR